MEEKKCCPTCTQEINEELWVRLKLDRTPRDILKIVSAMEGVSIEDMMSPSRKDPLVIARQIYFYVARKCREGFSLNQVGMEVNKDHGTVLHGARNIALRIGIEPEMRRRVKRYDEVTGYPL